jgi:hypothetical protein
MSLLHLQATSTSEEERLGVDFYKIWETRAKASTAQVVELESQPAPGAKPLTFSSIYPQGYADR